MKTAIQIVAAAIALLLAAAALPAQQSATEEADAIEYPPVYRVEVIVFSHVNGRSDRIRSKTPADFTDRLDPLLIARANNAAEQQLADLAMLLPVARIPGEIEQTTPYLETEEQTLRPIPPVYSALGDLSRPIQRAMDRLIDAPEYSPVTTRAWIQLARRGRSTATVRLHDQAVVDLIEPADERSLAPVPHVLPFGPLEVTPPPALEIYQLDGIMRLRQRQFLHLDLDLVWQTRSRSLSARMMSEDGSDAALGISASGDGEWELHRLRQSRIVEPGRFEYFDSSLFGVLVRIERFEQIVPEVPESETAPDPDLPDSPEMVDPVTNSGR